MTKSSPVDLVTETDQKVENFIISLIKEKYPSHRYGFLSIHFWQKKGRGDLKKKMESLWFF